MLATTSDLALNRGSREDTTNKTEGHHNSEPSPRRTLGGVVWSVQVVPFSHSRPRPVATGFPLTRTPPVPDWATVVVSHEYSLTIDSKVGPGTAPTPTKPPPGGSPATTDTSSPRGRPPPTTRQPPTHTHQPTAVHIALAPTDTTPHRPLQHSSANLFSRFLAVSSGTRQARS